MYIYNTIQINSFQNEKYFTQNCREYQNTYFVPNNIFSKIVPFMRQRGKF